MFGMIWSEFQWLEGKGKYSHVRKSKFQSLEE